MPATLHISPRLSAARFVIVDQSEAQDANGLVKVAVTYSVAPASVDVLKKTFYLDAPPPVFPSCTDRSTLQGSQGLYLLDFSTSKQFGLWIVQASYVGARNLISGQRPFVSRDGESRVTPTIKILAGYDVTPEEEPRAIPQYDSVIVRFIAQVVTTEWAGVGAGWFDLESKEQTASGLIYRVEYGNIELSKPETRTRFTLPAPRTLLDNFKPYVEISTSIRNITNNVIVAVTTRSAVFDPLALDNATNL